MARIHRRALTAAALGAVGTLMATAPAGAEPVQPWRWNVWHGSLIFGSPQNGEAQALGVACDDDGTLSLSGPALSDRAAGQPDVVRASSTLGSATLHVQLEEVDGVWFAADVKPGGLVVRTLLADRPLRLSHGRYWTKVPGGAARLLTRLIAQCRPRSAAH
jgi:hypothetical protein